MLTVKTSTKGQVVIPVEIREKLGIKPGQLVKLSIDGKRAVITPLPEDPIKALWGSLKGKPSLTKALLEERKQERELEEKVYSGFLCDTGLDSRGKRCTILRNTLTDMIVK
jgi:AbrB family looped-hinge helix DNA binding protein